MRQYQLENKSSPGNFYSSRFLNSPLALPLPPCVSTATVSCSCLSVCFGLCGSVGVGSFTKAPDNVPIVTPAGLTIARVVLTKVFVAPSLRIE